MAVWQDAGIEVYNTSDFEAVLDWSYRALPRDTHPKWRVMAWNPVGSLLACISSARDVTVFNSRGDMVSQSVVDASAVAGGYPIHTAAAAVRLVTFSNVTRMFVLGFDASITVFELPHDGLDHVLVPLSEVKIQLLSVATTMDYCSKHRLLIVGGAVALKSEQHPCGHLAVLRVTNEAPYLEPFAVDLSLLPSALPSNASHPLVQQVTVSSDEAW